MAGFEPGIRRMFGGQIAGDCDRLLGNVPEHSGIRFAKLLFKAGLAHIVPVPDLPAIAPRCAEADSLGF